MHISGILKFFFNHSYIFVLFAWIIYTGEVFLRASLKKLLEKYTFLHVFWCFYSLFYYFYTSLFSRNSLVGKPFVLKLPGNMLKPPLKLLNLPQFRPDHKKIVNPRLTHSFPMQPFSTP